MAGIARLVNLLARGLLLAILAILTAACGASATPAPLSTATPTQEPTSTSTPAPNIEATVEARVQATLAAIPTATPIPIPTATPIAIPTATPTPLPTATPTPLPTATPTPLPTATPTPLPTATPVPTPILKSPVTPKPASVYGILEVGFEPRGAAGTKVPEPPIKAAFVIQSVDGKERTEVITDPNPGASLVNKTTTLHFALALEPGKYQIVGLIGQHPELGSGWINFPGFRAGFGGAGWKIATLGFTVPSSGCIHTGRLSVTYFRVSPGSRAEQQRFVEQIAQEINDAVHYVYYPSGSLGAKSAAIARFIDREQWSDEAKKRDCQDVSALTEWIAE